MKDRLEGGHASTSLEEPQTEKTVARQSEHVRLEGGHTSAGLEEPQTEETVARQPERVRLEGGHANASLEEPQTAKTVARQSERVRLEGGHPSVTDTRTAPKDANPPVKPGASQSGQTSDCNTTRDEDKTSVRKASYWNPKHHCFTTSASATRLERGRRP